MLKRCSALLNCVMIPSIHAENFPTHPEIARAMSVRREAYKYAGVHEPVTHNVFILPRTALISTSYKPTLKLRDECSRPICPVRPICRPAF